MAKPAHKTLGIELRPDNVIRNTDPIGKVVRVGLDYSTLSAGQQARLSNKQKRTLGQTAQA